MCVPDLIRQVEAFAGVAVVAEFLVVDRVDEVFDLLAAPAELFPLLGLPVGDHVRAHGEADVAVELPAYFLNLLAIAGEEDVDDHICLLLSHAQAHLVLGLDWLDVGLGQFRDERFVDLLAEVARVEAIVVLLDQTNIQIGVNQ